MPTDVYAHINMRSSLGMNEVFGSGCNEYATDHYYIETNMPIDSVHALSLDLFPTYTDLGDGSVQVTLTPTIATYGEILDWQFNWETHDEDTFYEWMEKGVDFYNMADGVVFDILLSPWAWVDIYEGIEHEEWLRLLDDYDVVALGLDYISFKNDGNFGDLIKDIIEKAELHQRT